MSSSMIRRRCAFAKEAPIQRLADSELRNRDVAGAETERTDSVQ